jgi:glycerol-3-phosphate O-acyltransferase/dihydroxyacetone phosphate acyltransferase
VIAFIRMALLALVRLFYPTRHVRHGARLPAKGPFIVVANHPNGLIDPIVVRLAAGVPMHFLAKSTLFGNPLGRMTMEAFGGIPVYRARDGEDTSKNDRTFALCREALAAGRNIALFPEGTSHSDPTMKPLKTGAARIALSAVEAGAVTGSLPIIAAGLLFDDKATFRSAVSVTFGEPIDAVLFARDHGTGFAAAEALTSRIHDAMADVLLEAESSEVWRGLLLVAAYTDPACRDDLALRQARAQVLARAYRALVASQPEAAETLAEQVRRFVRQLDELGVTDPFALEGSSGRSAWWYAAPIVLLAPVAALGALLGWLPYRLVRPLAVKVAGRHDDLLGTIKLLAGLLVLSVTYLAESVLAGWLWGPAVGLATFVLAPAAGYVALRYDERVARRKALLSAAWLRATAKDRAEAVKRSREALVREVDALLGRG